MVTSFQGPFPPASGFPEWMLKRAQRDGERMTTTATDRIATLDIIRGVAVMGILSVNIVDFSNINASYLNPAALGWPDPASLAVWAANMLLVDGKFRTLFSMLFGASMLLVADRAEARDGSGWNVHWRRMVVLWMFGIAHFFLIWRGDILALYAVTGLFAFWFRNLSVGRLIGIGIALSLINVFLFGAIGLTLHYQELAVHSPGASTQLVRDWNANFHSFYPTAERVARDVQIYTGSWPTIVRHELGQTSRLIVNTILLLPDTLGLMLLGMAGLKSGFLTGEWEDRTYKRVAIWGIALGLLGFGLLVAAEITSRFNISVILAGFMAAVAPFRIVMAVGYAALFVLVSRKMGTLSGRFAAVGRAAFTNYLGSSLVMTSIFYGWGLGFYGSLTRAEAWLFVPLVWLLMLAWSKPWLDNFHYGPLEWLWRSLSRGSLQPLRKPERQPA